MSHVHVKINFSFGIDSWNRCLSVHKRLQIRALAGQNDNPIATRFLAPIDCLKIPALFSVSLGLVFLSTFLKLRMFSIFVTL